MLWQLRSCIFPCLISLQHREHKAQTANWAVVGCPGPLLEEQGEGIRLWESAGRKAKSGWASLPQLFHSPGNWAMLGVTPQSNCSLPCRPLSFATAQIFFSLNLLKSLQGIPGPWPQEKAVPILSWSCAFTNKPSPTPRYTLPIHRDRMGVVLGSCGPRRNEKHFPSHWKHSQIIEPCSAPGLDAGSENTRSWCSQHPQAHLALTPC